MFVFLVTPTKQLGLVVTMDKQQVFAELEARMANLFLVQDALSKAFKGQPKRASKSREMLRWDAACLRVQMLTLTTSSIILGQS